MKNGRAFFLLLMGMIVSLYTAFVVIGQDGPADTAAIPEDVVQEEAVAVEESVTVVEDVVAEEAPVEKSDAVAVPEPVAEPVPEPVTEVVTDEAPVAEVPAAANEGTGANPFAEVEEAAVEDVKTAEPVVENAAEVKGTENAAVEEAVPPAEGEPGEETPAVVEEQLEEGETVFVGVEADEGEIPGASAEKKGKGTISISLDDVEMADVVRMFTRISGANIIASPTNLVGRVTANLDDVEWQSAMETILDMHNLALMESPPGSKIFRIDPKVPGAPEPMKVKTYFLRYAQVSNATSVVSSMLSPGASLQAFPSRNALVVRSTSGNLGEIEEIISSIDVLRDQVFIEAKFMELNDSAIKDLGINWQVLQGYALKAENLGWNITENRAWDESSSDALTLNDSRTRQEGVVKGFDGLNAEGASGSLTQPDISQVLVAGGTPTYSYSDVVDKESAKTSEISDSFTKGIQDVRTAILGVDDFRVVLSALKQMNGVQIVSNPKLIVANEEKATIHIGQVERPFEAVVTPATQVEASTTKYTPGAPINFGVSLEVIPTINTASNITVTIMPELTRFVVNRTAPDGATYPVVASKKIKTMFCLESGKTVAIGGLTETVEQENVKKIPLLGDIPLIGKYLFSHSHTEKEQKETIIFVTVGLAHPETVNEYDGLPEDTELTHHKLMEKRLKKHKFQGDLEKSRGKMEEKLQKSERVKAKLAE